MPLARFLKTLLLSVTTLLLLGLAIMFGANALVLFVGLSQVEPDLTRLPAGATGLVLGTAPRLAGGAGPNPFFEARMESGNVNHLLLSGDNRRADYNEPVAMREALRQRGLPDAALTLDYAGFRTLDSVVRAKKVFQLEKNVVVITDDFHLPRALFLAHQTGLHAVGFPATPVPWKRSYRTRFREYFSRVRACLDVYLWKTPPHFLGDPGPIPGPATP
jgi:SanA protein